MSSIDSERFSAIWKVLLPFLIDFLFRGAPFPPMKRQKVDAKTWIWMDFCGFIAPNWSVSVHIFKLSEYTWVLNDRFQVFQRDFNDSSMGGGYICMLVRLVAKKKFGEFRGSVRLQTVPINFHIFKYRGTYKFCWFRAFQTFNAIKKVVMSFAVISESTEFRKAGGYNQYCINLR